jgi:hypothetical protein
MRLVTDDWLKALGVVRIIDIECYRENIVFVLSSFPACPKRVWLLHYTGLYTLHNFFLKLSRARFRRRVVCLIDTIQLKLFEN